MNNLKKLKIYLTVSSLFLIFAVCLNTGTAFAKYITENTVGTFTLSLEKSIPEPLYQLVDANGNPDETGGYILFGKYPQAQADAITANALTQTHQSALPSNGNNNGWTSYGYYQGTDTTNSGTADTDYMWYKDVEYDNETYRGVYFISYRPKFTHKASSSNADGGETHATNTLQYSNGYQSKTLYWFKYEWIKWKILQKNDDGTALIFSDLALDSTHFYNNTNTRTVNGKNVYANNYAHSDVRVWLNSIFYNTAFEDELQKAAIRETEVDHSTASGANALRSCENTNDKVFLLSRYDVQNNFGFSSDDASRMKLPTDYAKCQGVATGDFNKNGIFECDWLTRTPYSNAMSVYMVRGDAQDQAVGSLTGFSCNGTSYGVCPVLVLDLSAGQ